MGELIYDQDALSFRRSGSPPFVFGSELTEDFLSRLLGEDHEELPDICGLLSREAKLQLFEQSRRAGGSVWQQYCRQASRWASVTYPSNVWDLNVVEIVYEAPVGVGDLWRVLTTSVGARLLDVRGTPMSFAEFRRAYTMDVATYVRQELQREAERLERVMQVMTSPMVLRRVIYLDKEGRVCRRDLRVPEDALCGELRLREAQDILAYDSPE